MTKLGRSIVVAVVAAAALYWILSATYSDGRAVARSLAALPPSMLLLGLLLAALNYAVRFVKWHYYLKLLGLVVPLVDSALVFVSGFALTVTPGKIGEVVKSYLLRESYEIPIARSAPIVLAERLTDLVSLLFLSLLGASAWMTAEQRYVVAAGFGLCTAMLLLLSWRRLAHALLDLMPRLPPRRITKELVPKLRTFYDAAYALLRPGPLLFSVALSTLAWFFECMALYVVAQGAGAAASLLLCTFIYALMTVAGALALLPGGLGVTEGGMAVLLAELGHTARPAAVAATLVVRALTLWFAVLLGVLALSIYGRRRRLRLDLDAIKKDRQ